MARKYGETVAALLLVLVMASGVLLLPQGCGKDKDIMDLAADDGRLGTLVDALKVAGLEDALRGEGPFTLFAPTDEAFNLLPPGTLDGLLQNVPELQDILLYHVVSGELEEADLRALAPGVVETEQGTRAIVTVDGDNLSVDLARIIESDMAAKNGVIQVIDAVLVPPEDIVDTLVADGMQRFDSLVAAVQAVGLEDTLRGEGPFTLFAPTDSAFQALPPGAFSALLGDIPALTDVLLYHLVPETVLAEEIVTLMSLDTALEGETLTVTVDDGTAMVNDAEVIETDVLASNGIIHAVDAVLLPPE